MVERFEAHPGVALSEKILISTTIIERTKEISKLYKDQNLKFSIQKKQLGTGDAVKCVKDLRYVNIHDVTLILFADTPLIKINTLKKLVLKCKNKVLNYIIFYYII